MKFDNYMILDFPSRSTNEAFARSAVACFAAQMDPTLEELGDIRTAVSEAVTNCIVHAYPDQIGIITLRCRILMTMCWILSSRTRGWVFRMWSRPAERPSPPAGRSEAAWALPSWKAL